MRLSKVTTVALEIVLALACPLAYGQITSYQPLQLPSGKKFPVSEHVLIRARDTADGPSIRQARAHAWDLFGGLTGNGRPIWETWYTKCDVHLALKGCRKGGSRNDRQRLFQNFGIPLQSLVQLKQSLASRSSPGIPFSPALIPSELLADFVKDFRAHPQLASVFFNKEAANHILTHCLYPSDPALSPGESQHCSPSLLPPGKIAVFPKTSVVVKTVWAVVHPVDGSVQTWRPDLWNEVHQANVNPEPFGREVRVNSDKCLPCQNRDYADDEGIPISCFYYIALSTQDDVNAIPEDLPLVGRPLYTAGDFLVLVGVHVTTKEIPEWVWATFWWDNRGSTDWHSVDRPKGIVSPWNRFLMDTTLSPTTPVEEDGGPKICFNPFLETKMHNGIISNCLQCHSKAAYPLSNSAFDLGVLSRDGATLASGNPTLPSYFDDRVKTDFLWSLVSARDPKLKDLLDALLAAATK